MRARPKFRDSHVIIGSSMSQSLASQTSNYGNFKKPSHVWRTERQGCFMSAGVVSEFGLKGYS
jgi:hypothetical protein